MVHRRTLRGAVTTHLCRLLKPPAMAHGRKEGGFDLQIKLLTIGNSGVGKTCLLLRYANDAFSPTFITTIGESLAARDSGRPQRESRRRGGPPRAAAAAGPPPVAAGLSRRRWAAAAPCAACRRAPRRLSPRPAPPRCRAAPCRAARQ